MKVARFEMDSQERLGLVIGDKIVDLASRLRGFPFDMVSLISNWEQWCPEIRGISVRENDVDVARVRLLPPIRRPGKIFGLGFNYSDHAAEANKPIPTEQMWFVKASTAINGPYDPIQLPRVSDKLDYEAELVVVIGAVCKHVRRDEAEGKVFGYCAGNDVSVRDWQTRTSQFSLSKSFDSHAPIGPWITTRDSVNPHALDIECFVNGEQRQSSNTRHFVFDCFAMIEHLSMAMTLEPGDLLFTGTPSGVGATKKPQLWLKEGDLVQVKIEELGDIRNRVVPER
jgi:ureidoglycolate lyase